MYNIDRSAEVEIINAVSLILHGHKTIKDQSNILKRHGIDAESIIKEFDGSLNPSIPHLIAAALKNRKV